jgi:hypothetical protein
MGTWKGDSNPGGPGGRTRKMNPQPYRGRQTNTHKRGGGGKPPKKGCCPMVAAVRSVKQGQYRLARRYAAMSVRLISERVIRGAHLA